MLFYCDPTCAVTQACRIMGLQTRDRREENLTNLFNLSEEIQFLGTPSETAWGLFVIRSWGEPNN